MTKTKSALEAAYRSLIARNRLQHDPYQASLVNRLARLQHELDTTNNASAEVLKARLVTGQQAQSPPKGLYIYGPVGTGKSRIADLFAETLPPDVSRRRTHFHEFMNDIHQRLHEARSAPGYGGDPLIQIGKAIRAESRVLCFDEFQVTDIADAMILGRLFGSIWREGGVMVSTSNRHPDGLYERGLNRDVVMPFFRQLQHNCEVWEIGGTDDYRMKGLRDGSDSERIETFFTDDHAFKNQLLITLGDSNLGLVELPVYGTRTLKVTGICSDMKDPSRKKPLRLVHGTFEELCQANLASSDYHALCSSTDQIFLSGLRPFLRMEKDYARRFITMIDLAYEKGTRVVCSSSVALGELFAEIIAMNPKFVDQLAEGMKVKGEGGASSSMMSTFIGETEWSATGLVEASLATGGAGEADVAFAVGRAISRLYEMGSKGYGVRS